MLISGFPDQISKNCQQQVNVSGVQSVSYESEFTRTIGTCQPSDPKEKGHIVFIKIGDEHHPEFT